MEQRQHLLLHMPASYASYQRQVPVGYHAVSNLVLSPHELRYSVLPTRSMKDEVEYSYSPISFNEILPLIGRTPLIWRGKIWTFRNSVVATPKQLRNSRVYCPRKADPPVQ